jgi:hypothetical protein
MAGEAVRAKHWPYRLFEELHSFLRDKGQDRNKH